MKNALSTMWTFLLQRFRVTVLLVLFLSLWGVTSYNQMPRELTPQIDIPMAMVVSVWPGASPTDVESLVTKPIERKIENLDNVKEYTSSSRSGVSVISVEFDVNADKQVMIQKLKDKIDEARPDLPDSMPDEPQVNEISISDVPILGITISGDYSWSELKKFSEAIEEELEAVKDVKDVTVRGQPVDQVQIYVSPDKLRQYNIGISDITSALRSADSDVPMGIVELEGQSVQVSLKGQFQNALEFVDLPVGQNQGVVVRLSDVAEVRRAFDTFNVETFTGTEDGVYPSVSIEVIKSAEDGNVLTMVESVLTRVSELQAKGAIPKALNISTTFDRSEDIQESLDTLTTSLSQTLILIFIAMWIFLGVREAFLASLAIPLSLFGAIAYLNTQGFTFNGVSLFALVLSVGLLVDNAIIIVEGISSGIFEKKLKPYEAALETVKTFRWPIITGTLTTIFAFLPMMYFITGISGQYVRIIPIAVIAVLLFSLFVGMWVLPSLAIPFYTFFKPKPKAPSKVLVFVQKWYEEFMGKVLRKPGIRFFSILLLSIATLIGSVSLLIGGKIPVEVFPAEDQTFFDIKIELPEGSSLAETKAFKPTVESILNPYFEPQGENQERVLKNYALVAGEQDAGGTFSNIMNIKVGLTEKDARELTSIEMATDVRLALEQALPVFAEVTIEEQRGGPPTGAAVDIKIVGDDLERMETLVDEIKTKAAKIQGLKNVRDNKAEKTLQMHWRLDHEKLIRFGLSPRSLGETLRAAVNSVTVLEIVEGEDEIDTDLRIDWEGKTLWDEPSSLEYLEQIPLKTPSGQTIQFGQVASSTFVSELSQVRHEDGKRIINVQSDLEQGVTASEKTEELQVIIDGLILLPGEFVTLGGDNEENNRLISEMLSAMIAAAFLIMIVLVWQFNSFKQAFVVLSMVPFSLTGVFFGFYFAGFTLTFPTMIGIVALAGIIVNDAIVLLDRMNETLAEGKNRRDAYISAGIERMQPIFLTSLTTVVGMLPLSLSDPVWQGLGFAIVFGMMFSTFLTLILAPVLLRVGDFFSKHHHKED